MMPGIQKAFAVPLYPMGLAMALGKLMVGLSDLEGLFQTQMIS